MKSTWPQCVMLSLMFVSVTVRSAVTNNITTATADINATNVARHTYIVTLRREADQDGCVKELGVKRGMSWRHALNGFTADLDDAAVQRLKRDKRVLAVEPDGQVAPCIVNFQQTIPSGVIRMGLTNFPEAAYNRSGEPLNVDVAIVDSGIDTNHPDLNVVQSAVFDTIYTGSYAHGTAVAGVVGALNNDFGVVGVAPGVRLWDVLVLGQSSSWTGIIAGFDYFSQHANQISVINCSFGPAAVSYTTNPVVAVEQAVHNLISLRIVVVAGVGNFTNDIAGLDGVISTFDTNGNAITISGDDFIPASLPDVMAVSAMDPVTDTIANFSNFSKVPKVPRYVYSAGVGIDVAAPGVNILSTYLSGGSGYGYENGTSFSSPHVAGLVALYIAANGRATNAAGVYKIRQAIIDAALPQSQWNTNNTHDPDGNPEPLAIASTSWIPKPNIVSQSKTTGNVQLNFAAVPGYSYTAQYRDELSSGQWTNLSGLTIGIGNVAPASLNDTNPNPSARFYRVAMSPAPAAIVTTNASSVAAYLNGYGYGVVTNQSGIVNRCLRFVNPNLSASNLLTCVDVPPFYSGSSAPFGSYLNPNGPFTMEFWAKPARLVNDLFCPAASLENSQNGGNSRCGWIFYVTAGNQWQFSVGGTNGFAATVAGGTAQANVWQHVAGVYDGTNISLYVNGQLAAGPAAASGFAPNTTQPLRFGAVSDGTWTFDGWLDEPAIYTNVLSAAQISAHYDAATTNNAGYAAQILGDAPVGYWHFDE